MLFTIHCGHRPPHIRREGPTINPVLFERDDPSDLVDVTVARRHSSEREREGAKIRKAKYLTQLFTKWSIFVCNCEAVTCYLFYNGRVARGPDPTKKITHVPETFRAEQSRGAICFASPWITLLPNPFSEELFIESNRYEEFGLTQIFFKNVSTVLNCVVLRKNVFHGREMREIRILVISESTVFFWVEFYC